MKTFSKKLSAILAVLVLSFSLMACDGLGENDDEDANGLLNGILESNDMEDSKDSEDADSSDSGNLDEDEEPYSEGPNEPPRK